MQRKATAVWEGGLKDGKGTISTESGASPTTPYSFGTRFEGRRAPIPRNCSAPRTRAASRWHSRCSSAKPASGPSASRRATITFEKLDTGFTITRSHLDVTVRAPGADRAKFEQAAQNAKAGCPLSKVLKAEISMDARLEA